MWTTLGQGFRLSWASSWTPSRCSTSSASTSSTATGGPGRICSPSFVLHNKVVEVLNPLARDFKSVGNLRKNLAGLQEDLAKAHNQKHSRRSKRKTSRICLCSTRIPLS